jgi:hypothetical protein
VSALKDTPALPKGTVNIRVFIGVISAGYACNTDIHTHIDAKM